MTSRVRVGLTSAYALAALIFGASPSLAQGSDAEHRVFRLDGPGPHPAVAFVSGCNGFAPSFAPKVYERVDEQLRSRGYMVLFVDSLGRRGLQSCARAPISHGDAAKNLMTAVAWLRSQPTVDKARVSALGWSYGGGALLGALADYPEDQLGISRVVVYYPDCRSVQPWKAATPVLVPSGPGSCSERV